MLIQSSDALGPQIILRFYFGVLVLTYTSPALGTAQGSWQLAAATNVLRFTDLCCGVDDSQLCPGTARLSIAVPQLSGCSAPELDSAASKQPGQCIISKHTSAASVTNRKMIYLPPIQSTNTNCGAARRVL